MSIVSMMSFSRLKIPDTESTMLFSSWCSIPKWTEFT